jgi:catechol 2,3-dioxygenase-like lactoylglutathione lyase family enzyme
LEHLLRWASVANIDHLILKVNELKRSVAFYREILGFGCEGQDGPFTVIRVSQTFTLQLAPFGTVGREHYAFAMTRLDFDATLARLKERKIPYGPSFDSVGRAEEIGRESGAQGLAPTVYFFDPDNHLLEIRTYESGEA